MRSRFAFSYVAIGCLVVACGPGLPEPNAADAARAQAQLGHGDLGELQRGRKLYIARCGSCHALRDPMSVPPNAWAQQVRDMRVNQGVHLTSLEERQITAYLVSVSARSP